MKTLVTHTSLYSHKNENGEEQKNSDFNINRMHNGFFVNQCFKFISNRNEKKKKNKNE